MIDWLRFPLTVAVVFIHNFGEPVNYVPPCDMQGGVDGMAGYDMFRIVFSHVVPRLAVPLFFMMSGFLFFYRVKEWDAVVYFRKIKTRFRTLFIPYVLWNVASLCLTLAFAVAAYCTKGEPLDGKFPVFQGYGWLRLFWDCYTIEGTIPTLWGYVPELTGPVNSVLWFVRDLMVMSVLSPLVYVFVRTARSCGLAVLSLAYLFEAWPVLPGLSVTAVFFFTLGAYLSINGKYLADVAHRVRIPAYCAVALLFFPMVWYDSILTPAGRTCHQLFVFFGVWAVWHAVAWGMAHGRLRVIPLLSSCSFFVYAVHTLGMSGCCQWVADRLLPGVSPWMYGLRYVAVPLMVVLLSVGLYVLLRHFLPRLSAVLTGNR